ncbi:TspO/MBR-related protein [Pterulicium gracile]|uniref:TspO/MBR-related protein n=1 Tax=Pterulicium gracile TaxID=1884261 RepID=A0A5C3QEN1_9AGAR|nr:TspO/MBR-related protein [Pterula gracilis]
MSNAPAIPELLLNIARNPITAAGIPLTLGVLSGLPTRKVVRGQWWNSLYKAPLQPPGYAFGTVWPALYLSMGYASHLTAKALDAAASNHTTDDLNLGLQLYYAQLGMNFLWTPLFFVAKKPGLALINITALTGTTYYLTKLLHDATDGATTLFMAPYCAWLTFATYLNGTTWYLNRGRYVRKFD